MWRILSAETYLSDWMMVGGYIIKMPSPLERTSLRNSYSYIFFSTFSEILSISELKVVLKAHIVVSKCRSFWLVCLRTWSGCTWTKPLWSGTGMRCQGKKPWVHFLSPCRRANFRFKHWIASLYMVSGVALNPKTLSVFKQSLVNLYKRSETETC